MLMRLIGCVASATLASVAVALPAAAEGGGECTAYNSRGQCLFRATSDDSTNAREAKDERQTVRVSSCMWNGSPVPCSTSDGWYDAATGCYLSLDSDRPLLGPDPSKTDPTIQRYRCTLIVAIVDQRPAVEVMIQPVFRRKGRATPVVDPREVAREVVAEMTMRAIKIGMVPRPGRTGYVNLPVWMWVADPGPETTGPLTVTKAEQGLSITATATLDRIVWDMGDGSTVTCGAGTRTGMCTGRAAARRVTSTGWTSASRCGCRSVSSGRSLLRPATEAACRARPASEVRRRIRVRVVAGRSLLRCGWT